MGRSRSEINRRLGEGVQRRSGGSLELRLAIPEDVRHAFLDSRGQPRRQITRSLATSDVRLANMKADALRTDIRAQISEVRKAKSSTDLGSYLHWLYDAEMDDFRQQQSRDAEVRRRAFLGVVNGDAAERSKAFHVFQRQSYGEALISDDAERRQAAAGWAADEFFRRKGEQPCRDTPAYHAVLDECAAALTDAVIAKQELHEGRSEPEPMTGLLRALNGQRSGPSAQSTPRIGAYFTDTYVLAADQGGRIRGERNIPGKRHSIKLFVELVGDLPLEFIGKATLWGFLDKLQKLPDLRLLKGSDKKLTADRLLERVEKDEVALGTMSPKTANKHVHNITAVCRFAEQRAVIKPVDLRGVKAVIAEDVTGRPFTVDELNRLFTLPLYAGCEGEAEPAGLFKRGSVRINDDRLWLPLLLLFTGARSSEAAGLLIEDVDDSHDTPHVLIRPNIVRRLKNTHSKRMVPIHSNLISLGFLQFVATQREAGVERLFPMAEASTYREGATGREVARSVSSSLILRQFNRTVLAQADARSDRGSIKCFRNTFEHEGVLRIHSDEMRQRLLGRKVVSSSREYVENIPRDAGLRSKMLIRLGLEMEKIEFEGVELHHLARVSAGNLTFGGV